MSIRGRIRRLEHRFEEDMVAIPQADGGVRRFPQESLQESFLANMKRLRGEEAEPHPLGVAATNSPDPGWSRSLYSAAWVDIVSPPEDLSK